MSPILSGWGASRRPFLVDRCIPKSLAEGLGKFPVHVLHLHDAYPGRAEAVKDPEWIEDAGLRGYAVLTANPKMLTIDAEMDAIRRYGTKVFCLANAQHTREGRALIIGRHYLSIVRRAGDTGPCFWRIDPQRTTYDIP